MRDLVYEKMFAQIIWGEKEKFSANGFSISNDGIAGKRSPKREGEEVRGKKDQRTTRERPCLKATP